MRRLIGMFFALYAVMAYGWAAEMPPAARPSMAAVEQTLPTGLTAYLPFDGDLSVQGPQGGYKAAGVFHRKKADDGRVTDVPVDKVDYDFGLWGDGLKIGADEAVQVRSWQLFSATSGTVACWIMPLWNPDMPSPNWTLVSAGSLRLAREAGDDLRLLAGRTLIAHCQGVIGKWEPESWHHIAVTWDAAAGEAVLYCDGNVAARGSYKTAVPLPGAIMVGPATAELACDALMTWNRAITADEVRVLALAEKSTSACFSRIPPQPEKKVCPLQLTLKIEEPVKTIVAPGETYVSSVTVKNPATNDWSGDVQFTLIDYWNRPRETKTVPVRVPLLAAKEVTVPFAAPECGVFKVRMRVPDGGNTWERDISSFAAWPVPAGPPNADSFFGNHITAWEEDGRFLAQGARLGLGWNRDHNMTVATWWPTVEPEDGQFAWQGDYQIANNTKYHMPVLGQFMGTPYWAAAKGPLKKQSKFAYPYPAVPDLAKFRRYVFETVSHYKETIHYWEVWNEPHTTVFWTGTPEQYAELANAAIEEAKRADPGCTVMVGGLSLRPEEWAWNVRMAKAGGLKHIDALSFHWYPLGPDVSPEEQYLGLKDALERFTKLLAEYGPGHPVPWWNSEGGDYDVSWLQGGEEFENRYAPGTFTGAYWQRWVNRSFVQAPAIQQALGITRQFYYLQNSTSANDVGTCSMLEWTNAPRPKYLAWAAMAAQVDGAAIAGLVRRPEDGRFWAVIYRKANAEGSVVVWWAGDGGRISVQADWPGPLVKTVNIMGNAVTPPNPLIVTEEPYYLHLAAPAEKVITALQAAKITVVIPPLPITAR